MNHDIDRPINEIGRIVIHLPDDAMFYRDRSYLPVAIDQADEGLTARLAGDAADDDAARGAAGRRVHKACTTPEGIGAVCGRSSSAFGEQNLLVHNARRHRSCLRS